LSDYKKDGIVIQGKLEESKEMFWASHSPIYLKEILFKDFTVLDYFPEKFPYTV
jgi:hypothetical protein